MILQEHSAGDRIRAQRSAITRILPFCLFTLLILVVGVIRRPGVLWPTLYFEDGSIFYADQLLTPSWSLLFRSFAGGYALPIPRLTALLAYEVTPRWAPYVFNGVGLITCSLCAALFSLRHFRPALRSDAARVVLCLLFGLCLDNTEVLTSTANCFWAMGLAVFLLTLSPPETQSTRSRIWAGLGSAALAYATPVCLIASPLAVLGLLRTQRARYWPWHAGLLTGAFLGLFSQSPALYSASKTVSVHSRLLGILTSLADRVVLSSLAGHRSMVRYLNSGDVLTPLLCLVAVSLLLCILFTRGSRPIRERALLGSYVLFANLLASLSLRNLFFGFQQITGADVLSGGPRYFYLSCCAFAFLVALAAEGYFTGDFGGHLSLVSGTAGRTSAAVCAVLGVTFSFGFYKNFRSDSGTRYSWNMYADQIAAWEEKRAIWLRASDSSLSIHPVLVPIQIKDRYIFLPGDRLLNGGFEEGDDGRPWLGFGDMKIGFTDVNPDSGGRCLVLHGSSGGAFNDLFFLPVGAQFQVSAYARSEEGKTTTALLWVTDGDTKQYVDGPREIRGQEWQRFSLKFPVSSTRRMRIHLATQKGGPIYWDSVEAVNAADSRSP